MLTFINILSILFIVLISYQLIKACTTFEGLENNNEYRNYDTDNLLDALILDLQNIGNIEYINQRTHLEQDIYHHVKDLTRNVIALQEQVKSIVLAKKDCVNSMNGGILCI